MTREEMKELAGAWADKAKVELKFGKRPDGLSISGGESVVFDGRETDEDFVPEHYPIAFDSDYGEIPCLIRK